VELAGEIGVSPAQTSGMVERLHRRGLVAMRRQAIDRRRQLCETSAAGIELLARVAVDLERLAVTIRDDLNAEDQHLAEALCQRLTAALKETGQPDKQRTSREAA
jgi:DNA-binding MarR family transcriptional regulator